jgi:hypothetical protein
MMQHIDKLVRDDGQSLESAMTADAGVEEWEREWVFENGALVRGPLKRRWRSSSIYSQQNEMR